MNADAKDTLFTAVTITKLKVDSTTIGRLREFAINEVYVENFDRAFLALVASEEFGTMRESQQTRIVAIGGPLKQLYFLALIAADVNAHELNVRRLAGETMIVIAYRFKAYSLRAGRDFSDMLLTHYEEIDFTTCPVFKY